MMTQFPVPYVWKCFVTDGTVLGLKQESCLWETLYFVCPWYSNSYLSVLVHINPCTACHSWTHQVLSWRFVSIEILPHGNRLPTVLRHCALWCWCMCVSQHSIMYQKTLIYMNTAVENKSTWTLLLRTNLHEHCVENKSTWTLLLRTNLHEHCVENL